MPSNKAVHPDLGEILGTKPESIAGEEGRAIPAPTPRGVEVIDLPCSVREGNCELSDDEDRVSDDEDRVGSDTSCDATFSRKIGHQTAGSEEFIDKRTSRENTSNERSSQPVPLGDSRQGKRPGSVGYHF
ncbi:hypothetical protein K458DRAFT_96655 [Lentithecium fluviatile CBS 122367]|uniref:Uncharacterized protein n=1 Tax=Lentithecium fluviatile CBS 122367 TaxID=1168545 RepID=A0A6G1JHI2_9PLEO|nr:hypothetical protein K458DRAFT_96655 [Lentithecium fluviatile CBS 122367]